MRRKLKWIIIAVVVAVIAAPAIAFVLYTGDYYRLPEVLGREAQYIESRAYGNMHNRK